MSEEAGEATARLRIVFARMALAAATLTFVVIVASAFMRHSQAGLACADWPSCYGRIETADAVATPSAGVRLARVAHRIAATGVLVLVIGMLLVAWTQRPAWKREGTLAVGALAGAGALAALGIVTPGARLPAVTLGNLLGGYLMLALLAALVASASPLPGRTVTLPRAVATLRRLALAILVLTLAQAALGGTIGAQYALPACPTLGKCPGFPLNEFALSAALDAFHPLTIVDGRVVAPSGAAGVHMLHRAFGIVLAVLMLALAHRLRVVDRWIARALAALAVAVPLAGVAAIAAIPSLPLTVLHNGCAAFVVATLAAAAARLRTAT